MTMSRLNEINSNKRDRRPVTDTNYQIAAWEFNALVQAVLRMTALLNELLPGSLSMEGLPEYVTDTEVRDLLRPALLTPQEYRAIRPKEPRLYFVAKDAEARDTGLCRRIYFGSQLALTLPQGTCGEAPVFPLRFPVRLS